MLFLIEQLILIWHINYNLYNDNKNGQKVFSAIEDELLRCDRIAISVAFITRGGITPLLQTLKELEKREKIIIFQYTISGLIQKNGFTRYDIS